MTDIMLPEAVEHALQGGRPARALVKVLALQHGLMVSLFIWLFGFMVIIVDVEEGSFYTLWVILVNIIVLALTLLWAVLYVEHYSFGVYSDRIEVKRGIIGRREVSIPFGRIQNVEVYRGILDRLMGIGSVHVETAGSSRPIMAEGMIMGLRNPQPVADYLLRRVKGLRQPDAAGMGDDDVFSAGTRYGGDDMMAELQGIRTLLEEILRELRTGRR